MGDFHLTAFDLAALAIILISSIMALARGLLREVFSIVAFIAAALAALYGRPFLSPALRGFLQPPILAELAAAGILFLLVFVLITFLTSTLAKAAHRSGEIGTLDRGAGFLFGAARGVLILALFVLLMRHITGAPQAPMPSWIAEAKTYPVFAQAAEALDSWAPHARDYIKDRAQQPGPAPPLGPPSDALPPPAPAQDKG